MTPTPATCATRPKYLCHCLRVTEDEVRNAVSTCALSTVCQVRQACGAGGGCTACHRHIRRVLAEESPVALAELATAS